MSIETLKNLLPEYAKDIKLNLSSIASETGTPGLTTNQAAAITLASAYAVKNPTVIENVLAQVKNILSDAEINATKIAATIMAMNNIYYRFVHMVNDKDFSTLPAKLRMNAIGNPGIEKADFELLSLAVSAINGCEMCINAHVHEVLKAGISKEGVQSAIRIAAILNATGQAIAIEQLIN